MPSVYTTISDSILVLFTNCVADKCVDISTKASIKEMVAIYSNKKPKGEYVIIVQGKGK